MEREGDRRGEQGEGPLIVPSSLLQQVLGTLEAALPFEGGGLLFGKKSVTEWVGERFFLLPSALLDAYSFEADPRVLTRVLFLAKSENWDLLATVHSHPQGDAVPSTKDLREAFAYQGIYHGIVSFSAATPVLRFFDYQKIDQHYFYQLIPHIVTTL